jgi:hypothetical protein
VINIPYEILEKIIRSYPRLPPEEAVRKYIIDSLKGEAPKLQEMPTQPSITKSDFTKLQRMIIDILNPFTAKVDDVSRKISQMIEILEELGIKVSALEKVVEEYRARPIRARAEAAKEVTAREAPPHRERKSAMDFLREQKIMFESDIARRIRNRDAFFERLRRDGAVVLELRDERVAVDPDFWDEFINELESINTNVDDDLKKKMRKDSYILLKALAHSGSAYFDNTEKKWKVMVK